VVLSQLLEFSLVEIAEGLGRYGPRRRDRQTKMGAIDQPRVLVVNDNALVEQICGAFERLTSDYSPDGMHDSLLPCVDARGRRKFASFTASELCSLIRALFEDSVRRQNILDSILHMGD